MNFHRAVLRDENGDHICTLTDAVEIDRLEHRATAGEVIRSQKLKKGRMTLIFRLKTAELPPVKASNSRDTDCLLTPADMRMIAGLDPMTTREMERLRGHGYRPLHNRIAAQGNRPTL